MGSERFTSADPTIRLELCMFYGVYSWLECERDRARLSIAWYNSSTFRYGFAASPLVVVPSPTIELFLN
jgi:hypothetical protein